LKPRPRCSLAVVNGSRGAVIFFLVKISSRFTFFRCCRFSTTGFVVALREETAANGSLLSSGSSAPSTGRTATTLGVRGVKGAGPRRCHALIIRATTSSTTQSILFFPLLLMLLDRIFIVRMLNFGSYYPHAAPAPPGGLFGKLDCVGPFRNKKQFVG